MKACVCWEYVHEWLYHSAWFRDAHKIPTLVGIATVGQCAEVHLEAIPRIQMCEEWMSRWDASL